MSYQETLFIATPGDTYKALETGISLHRGPIGEPGGWLLYQGL